jgi:hypothetical protein
VVRWQLVSEKESIAIKSLIKGTIIIYSSALHTSTLSVQDLQSRSCLSYVSYAITANLVTWTIVRLTTATLEPLYFLCLASHFPIQRTCPFSWFCKTSACYLHNLLCNRIYTEGWKLCANRGPVCTLENVQWCTEPCFVCAAILRSRCLPLLRCFKPSRL